MEKAALVLSIFSFVCSSVNLIVFIIHKKQKRKTKTNSAYERCKWDVLSEEEKRLLNLD